MLIRVIDFDLDPRIQQLDSISKPFSLSNKQDAMSGGLYKNFIDRHQAHRIETSSNLSNWKDFFKENTDEKTVESGNVELPVQGSFITAKASSALTPLDHNAVFQLNQTYIVFEQKNGITLLQQQLAHQQILFEKFSAAWQGKGMAIQQNLFPVAINVSPTDAPILTGLLPDLLHMGYQLEPFGGSAFLLQGSPADHPSENDQSVIEMILEDVKDGTASLHQAYKEKISKALARKHAVKTGVKLGHDELRLIVEQLMECTKANTHFDGKPTYLEISKDYLSALFGI